MCLPYLTVLGAVWPLAVSLSSVDRLSVTVPRHGLVQVDDAGETDDWGAAGAADAPRAQRRAQLLLLFMASDDLPHLELWREWLASAPAGSWQAYLHCVNETACRQGPVASWPDLSLVPTVSSEAIVDLVSPMHQLLKHSLATRGGEGRDSFQKFIFISDTTLPAKPFSSVYQEFGEAEVSDMCLFPTAEWGTAMVTDSIGRKHLELLMKQHQWVVLTRMDAERFADKWIPGSNFGTGWDVPLKGNGFADENKSISSKEFDFMPLLQNKVPATDEFAFASTLYGAFESGHMPRSTYYPEMGLSVSDGPSTWMPTVFQGLNWTMSHPSQGRCRTKVFWTTNDTVLDDPEVKFAPPTYLLKGGHSPVEFDAVGRTFLQHMRDTSFLFMRKFKHGAVQRKDFVDVVCQ